MSNMTDTILPIHHGDGGCTTAEEARARLTGGTITFGQITAPVTSAEIEPGTDLDTITDPGVYVVRPISEPITITGTITLPRRKMTRKRFIKLLMSKGIQRDTAYIVADITRRRAIPYGIAGQLLGLCF